MIKIVWLCAVLVMPYALECSVKQEKIFDKWLIFTCHNPEVVDDVDRRNPIKDSKRERLKLEEFSDGPYHYKKGCENCANSSSVKSFTDAMQRLALASKAGAGQKTGEVPKKKKQSKYKLSKETLRLIAAKKKQSENNE